MTIAAAALLLFLILDPLGNIPILLSLFKDLPAARQRKVLLRELLIALFVLMLFLWGGHLRRVTGVPTLSRSRHRTCLPC